MPKKEFSNLNEILELLKSVEDKPQKREERAELAINLAEQIYLLTEKSKTEKEKKAEIKFYNALSNPKSKPFLTCSSDQLFRSKSIKRASSQLHYLLFQFGIPENLSFLKKLNLSLFKISGKLLSYRLMPLFMKQIKRGIHKIIFPKEPFAKQLQNLKNEQLNLNINEISELSLGKISALKNLDKSLKDLKNPDIEYISLRVPMLFPQLSIYGWEDSLEKTTEELEILFKAAKQNLIKGEDGGKYKFVTLEIDRYEYLRFSIALFKKILDNPEFHDFSAGIVLQSYFPDAFSLQKELTAWAKERVAANRAPIKITIAKGAFLGQEEVEASKKNWPLATFSNKIDTDANFKRMLEYGLKPENCQAANIGIATHNILDIAYALLLISENQVSKHAVFEMFHGRTPMLRTILQKIYPRKITLCCPLVKDEEINNTIPFIIRRIEELTGPDNFQKYLFLNKIKSQQYEELKYQFRQSVLEIDNLSDKSKREQNRNLPPLKKEENFLFDNEPATDFSIEENRVFAKNIVEKWSQKEIAPIPVVIGEKQHFENCTGQKEDPSLPQRKYYFSLAENSLIEKAFALARQKQKKWEDVDFKTKSKVAFRASQLIRERRSELIGAIMRDTGKSIIEADKEVSNSIDVIEYYRQRLTRILNMRDVALRAKGICLVISSQGFPCYTPLDHITAAMLAGNSVIFKPSLEGVLSGYAVANVLWDAGIPKENLIFLPCSNENVETALIDPKKSAFVLFSGRQKTAKKILSLEPELNLTAWCEGKNTMIITALSDRSQAIRDLVKSAFNFSGQKPNSCNLAILEAEVYEDANFLQNLTDAVSSLTTGPAWNLNSKITPLIHEIDEELRKALTLEKEEKWLLEPKISLDNKHLISPGIKLNVEPGSYTQTHTFSGPILGLIKAKNFTHALEIANNTPYGLSIGLQSLDPREHYRLFNKIETGCCFINRDMVDMSPRKQPFGGTKESSFGNACKLGGPNFLFQCFVIEQIGIPKEKIPTSEAVNNLTYFLDKITDAEELGLFYASTANYAFWWKKLKQEIDYTKVIGQDNILRYLPKKGVLLRLTAASNPLDALRVVAACLTVSAPLEISLDPPLLKSFSWAELIPQLKLVLETENELCERFNKEKIKELRLVSKISSKLKIAAQTAFISVDDSPVLSNGRLELLKYTREVLISYDYHRYGYLGSREGELRKPLRGT